MDKKSCTSIGNRLFMIEPISSRSTEDLWAAYAERQKQIADSQIGTDDAEEEVVSLWYLSSVKSMQSSVEEDNKKIESSSIQSNKIEQSRFQRFTTWLWGLFGGSNPKESTEIADQQTDAVEENISVALPRTPQLQPPELISNERLVKAIADINKDLLHRIKDTAEFSEEMRNSNDMDRLILFHLVSKSLDQKRLKEEAGLELHEHILNLQKLNKELHKKHYCLLDDINATAKTNQMLHWVSVGSSVGVVGTLVAGYLTGGLTGVFAFTIPALNILKGGATGVEGVMKYKNDLRTGEVTNVNHDIKVNRNNIESEVNGRLPIGDEEISHLLKSIREHLANYNKEVRMNP